MAQSTLTAFFDSRSEATEAVNALVAAGIPRTSIQITPESDSSSYRRSDRSSYDYNKDEGGFFSSLADFIMPDEDRYAYAEGMSRGGVTVSVTTADASQSAMAMDVLEEHGAVDMDERETSWKSEGWTGYTAGSTAPAGANTTSGATTSIGTTGLSGSAASVRSDASRAVGDEVIPIVEENLRVGKRDVSHGRVRIRSYVVETPVSESVSLREETVHVERRPVDRAVTGDEALFRERTIEAEERSEEAVVSKEARVKEELVIKKDVEQRTETVQDTVRRTEVDVDDERLGQDTIAGSSATPIRR
ncbi:MAG: YsnF/AvaK domain-containing protein [Microvirga sp.]